MSRNAGYLYVIVWLDAHGERQENFRRGKNAGEFISELFRIGCKLISVTLAEGNGN